MNLIFAILKHERNRKFDVFSVRWIFISLMNTKNGIFTRGSATRWCGRMVRWCWVNIQCRGVLLIWIWIGQGPTVLAIDAGGCCLDIFSLVGQLSFLSPSLWETTRYRLKYCLKGPLNPKQPTNQPPLVKILLLVSIRWNKNRSYTEKVKYPLYHVQHGDHSACSQVFSPIPEGVIWNLFSFRKKWMMADWWTTMDNSQRNQAFRKNWHEASKLRVA